MLNSLRLLSSYILETSFLTVSISFLLFLSSLRLLHCSHLLSIAITVFVRSIIIYRKLFRIHCHIGDQILHRHSAHFSLFLMILFNLLRVCLIYGRHFFLFLCIIGFLVHINICFILTSPICSSQLVLLFY